MVATTNIAGTAALRPAVEADLAGEETSRSAVAWSAIFVGAVAATATSLMLMILGSGLGLTMVSPWENRGTSAATAGVAAVIWIVVVQWLASALGGYLTGRLRAKWVRIHTDEVFFRDTAHGFLAWALATVAGASLFALMTAWSVAGAARGATEAAANAAPAAVQAMASRDGDEGYFADLLMRTTNPVVDVSKVDNRLETLRILSRSQQEGTVTLSAEDRTYLGQMVAARTGMNQAEAETRVDAIVAQLNDAQQKARAAADEARKRTAQLSIMVALSMVVGAFIASAAAALGGQGRDGV
jgi:hypothetical protein